MINQALLLLWTFAFSSARAQLSDGVFGAGPWNASYAQEGNRNPKYCTKTLCDGCKWGIDTVGDKRCMKDLANVTSSQLSGSCTGAWMPKSCISRLGTGGLLSHNLVGRLSTNDTTDPLFQESPLGFGWYQSPVHSAGNSSYYQREADRLYAVFFHGNSGGIVSICSRVNTTRLNKDSNAVTSGASSFKRSSHFSVLLALTVVVFVF